jgi:hypothetical protein
MVHAHWSDVKQLRLRKHFYKKLVTLMLRNAELLEAAAGRWATGGGVGSGHCERLFSSPVTQCVWPCESPSPTRGRGYRDVDSRWGLLSICEAGVVASRRVPWNPPVDKGSLVLGFYVWSGPIFGHFTYIISQPHQFGSCKCRYLIETRW